MSLMLKIPSILIRSFLGEITPSMIGITYSSNYVDELTIKVIFNSPLSELDRESLDEVHTEIISDIPDFKVSVEGISQTRDINYIDDNIGKWFFLQKKS